MNSANSRSALPSEHSPTWVRVLLLTVALCVVALMSVQPQAENDFWLQAHLGELMLSEHSIPNTLRFPFTEASEYHFNAHEWLASIGFHIVLRTVGENNLPFVLGGLGLALFTVVFGYAYRHTSGSMALALACSFVVIVSENFRHFLRPELLSLFFLWSALRLLDALVRKPAPVSLVSLLILQVIWANCHGSFLLLPILGTITSIHALILPSSARGQVSRRHWMLFWLGLPVSLMIASFLTPFGLELWHFALSFSGESVAKGEIMEWMPLSDARSHSINGIGPAVGVGLLLMGVLIVERRMLDLRHAGVALLFLALGVQANRFLVYLGLVLAWLAPNTVIVRGWMEGRIPLWLTGALWAMLGANVFQNGNLNGAFPWDARSNHALPHALARYLEQGPLEGRVFNSYDLGAELIYRGYPRLRPSIDSRIDSYGDRYFYWHESLLDTPIAFTHFLQHWNVRYLLLNMDDYSRYNGIAGAIRPQCHLLATDRRIFLLGCDSTQIGAPVRPASLLIHQHPLTMPSLFFDHIPGTPN